MKSSILGFALAVGVSLNLALGDGCFTGFLGCHPDAQNFWNLIGTGDICSKIKPVLQCYLDVSVSCGDGLQVVLEGLHSLMDEACLPGSTISADIQKGNQCITKHISDFKGCPMDREANNLAEMCGLVQNFLKCYTVKAQELCSPAEALERVLNPFIKSTTTCSRNSAFFNIVLDACQTSNVKCVLKTLSNGEVKCTDLQKFGKCILDAPAHCNPIRAIVPYLEKYLNQIPDYCDSESPFRKNLDISYQCILPKLESTKHCTEKAQEELQKLATPRIRDNSDPRMKGVSVGEQMLSCIMNKVGTPCGKEAEFVVRFLMKPNREMLDEVCLAATKKRCNESEMQQERDATKKRWNENEMQQERDATKKRWNENEMQQERDATKKRWNENEMQQKRNTTKERCSGASGIMSASWLLFLSVMFLLTRYCER